MVGSFPLDLSEVIDVEMIVLLRFKPYNKDHPHSSIAVVQYSRDPDILEKFCYTKVMTYGKISYLKVSILIENSVIQFILLPFLTKVFLIVIYQPLISSSVPEDKTQKVITMLFYKIKLHQ